jgi:hypothetical protein
MIRLSIVGRRACATVAAGSALLHGISLVDEASPAVSAVTMTMLAACLYCARDLWVHATLRAWVTVALMNLAMIAIHMPAVSGHRHGAGVGTTPPMHLSTAMTAATWLALAEVTAATAVLLYRTRSQWAISDAAE